MMMSEASEDRQFALCSAYVSSMIILTGEKLGSQDIAEKCAWHATRVRMYIMVLGYC
jgi:hypothetical protein